MMTLRLLVLFAYLMGLAVVELIVSAHVRRPRHLRCDDEMQLKPWE